jgi:hypothetical protein
MPSFDDRKTAIDRQPESATTPKPIETPAEVEMAPIATETKTSVSVPERSALSKIKRGDEIYALYTSPRQNIANIGKSQPSKARWRAPGARFFFAGCLTPSRPMISVWWAICPPCSNFCRTTSTV